MSSGNKLGNDKKEKASETASDEEEINQDHLHLDEEAWDTQDKMRNMILSSLVGEGEGYDEQSLLEMDRRLCDYFLPDDSFYYDDDHDVTKSKNPEKPSDSDIEHYKKSMVLRQDYLNKATTATTSVEATSSTNSLEGGNDRKNVPNLYEDLYRDIKSYFYAWFEIIFKEKQKDLFSANQVLVKLANLKLEDDEIDEVIKIMGLINETKDIFQSRVKERDDEACRDAGVMEFDYYQLCYKISLELAKSNHKKKKEEVEYYFERALSAENLWGYEEEYCKQILEYATGKKNLCDKDVEELVDANMDNDEFFYGCVKAKLDGKEGSITSKLMGPCKACGKEATTTTMAATTTTSTSSDDESKFRKCQRCKEVWYCSKECLRADWKRHKKECGKEK